MESLSGQHSGGLGLHLQMGDDVADKADNSADRSIIEISNHTVDTCIVLASLQRLANNMCSVLGLQFVKGNRDRNKKPLDIALDQAHSIRGHIKSDGNCFLELWLKK